MTRPFDVNYGDIVTHEGPAVALCAAVLAQAYRDRDAGFFRSQDLEFWAHGAGVEAELLRQRFELYR